LFRSLLFTCFLLFLSLSLDSKAEVELIIDECKGCHTSNRLLVEERFSNGFGKWKDPQCFGCHQEITEIAIKFNSGVKDQRYYTLPVSDSKLKVIGHYSLSYLNAPLNPVKNSDKRGRFTRLTLLRFLQRPFGQCNKSGECQAPLMMAYPTISQRNIEHFSDWLSPFYENKDNNLEADFKDDLAPNLGAALFNEKCSGCHSDSDLSGYDSVGLSLFSHQWIFNYANRMTHTVTPERKMPAIAISMAEASQLAIFFQNQRLEKEQQLEQSLNEIPNTFLQDDKSALSKSESFYLWKRLWRDNNCVHCHGIEGRANNAFDTSEVGITRWLTNNDPFDLYARLITREKESQFGIGAKVPGMPMTKSPVPTQVTSLLSRWIKNGCINLNEEALCVQNTQNNEKQK
jgi:mono/diheme cytochrome c family protein